MNDKNRREDPDSCLQDIVDAADAIGRYTDGVTEDQFGRDEMRQDAVIRRIEVIGEAADRLMKAVPEHEKSFPGLPLADAKRMRNFVIHGYDGVDFGRVWDTAINDLPGLRDKAAHLLDERRTARGMAGADLPQP